MNECKIPAKESCKFDLDLTSMTHLRRLNFGLSDITYDYPTMCLTIIIKTTHAEKQSREYYYHGSIKNRKINSVQEIASANTLEREYDKSSPSTFHVFIFHLKIKTFMFVDCQI